MGEYLERSYLDLVSTIRIPVLVGLQHGLRILDVKVGLIDCIVDRVTCKSQQSLQCDILMVSHTASA